MTEYYFDTYALLQLVNKAPSYANFSNCTIITSTFTLLEFYYCLLRDGHENFADVYFDKLLLNSEEVPPDVIKLGARFRIQINKELPRSKKPLSHIDALTYVFAKTRKVKFLTGDASFEGLENVEYVK